MREPADWNLSWASPRAGASGGHWADSPQLQTMSRFAKRPEPCGRDRLPALVCILRMDSLEVFTMSIFARALLVLSTLGLLAPSPADAAERLGTFLGQGVAHMTGAPVGRANAEVKFQLRKDRGRVERHGQRRVGHEAHIKSFPNEV